MKEVNSVNDWTELADVTVGKTNGHVLGRTYHDADVLLLKRDGVYRVEAVEHWGSCQGYDQEHGRIEVVAQAGTLSAAFCSIVAKAEACGVKNEGAEYMRRALNKAFDIATEAEREAAQPAAYDQQFVCGIREEAQDVIKRLNDYDTCHDGDVDKAAKIIERLLKYLPADESPSDEDKQLASPTYLERHDASGIKAGDWVKVVRKSAPNGWEARWVTAMDKLVGGIYEVQADRGIHGFTVKHGWGWHVPCTSLEKVPAPPKETVTEAETVSSEDKPSAPPTYLEQHEASGIKAGDWVKVVSKSEPCGWDDKWLEAMNALVGGIFQVAEDAANNGFTLLLQHNGRWNVPCTSLEKVSAPKKAYRPFESMLEWWPHRNRHYRDTDGYVSQTWIDAETAERDFEAGAVFLNDDGSDGEPFGVLVGVDVT